jgi:hypothetical protein
MRYTVRNQDGELDFPTFADVAKAYRQGLVDPEDEVREEGATAWRKAGALPELRGARLDASPSIWKRSQAFSIALAVVLGLAAMYVMSKMSVWVGIALLLADGMLLIRIATRAHSKKN